MEGFQVDCSAHVGWARDEDKFKVNGGPCSQYSSYSQQYRRNAQVTLTRRDEGVEGFQVDFSANVGWARDEDKVEVRGVPVVCPVHAPSSTGPSNPHH